jgi:hypothetical protein
MIMADILLWTLIILGVYGVLVAYWVGAYALFPSLVERCRATYGVRPVASTLVGLVIALPALGIGIAAAKALPHPVVQLPVIGALLLVGLLCLVGSAGLALRIGSGMPSPHDAAQPWRRLLRGGMVLGLAFVMPFLGWFVLLPWALVSGLGAFVLSPRSPAPVDT